LNTNNGANVKKLVDVSSKDDDTCFLLGIVIANFH